MHPADVLHGVRPLVDPTCLTDPRVWGILLAVSILGVVAAALAVLGAGRVLAAGGLAMGKTVHRRGPTPCTAPEVDPGRAWARGAG